MWRLALIGRAPGARILSHVTPPKLLKILDLLGLPSCHGALRDAWRLGCRQSSRRIPCGSEDSAMSTRSTSTPLARYRAIYIITESSEENERELMPPSRPCRSIAGTSDERKTLFTS